MAKDDEKQDSGYTLEEILAEYGVDVSRWEEEDRAAKDPPSDPGPDLPWPEARHTPPPQNVDQAELVFAGSWTDKGTLTPAMQVFLHSLYGKRVAIFGTAGFGISELYFASLSDRFKGEVPKGNQVVSTFFCTGKMPQAVRDRYEAQLKEKPDDARLKSMLQAFDLALTHPDQADLAQAADFAREAIKA